MKSLRVYGCFHIGLFHWNVFLQFYRTVQYVFWFTDFRKSVYFMNIFYIVLRNAECKDYIRDFDYYFCINNFQWIDILQVSVFEQSISFYLKGFPYKKFCVSYNLTRTEAYSRDIFSRLDTKKANGEIWSCAKRNSLQSTVHFHKLSKHAISQPLAISLKVIYEMSLESYVGPKLRASLQPLLCLSFICFLSSRKAKESFNPIRSFTRFLDPSFGENASEGIWRFSIKETENFWNSETNVDFSTSLRGVRFKSWNVFWVKEL